MKKMREKKMNNKGFSLVELIIVVAIMVVLVGVLAPQYLKYVEKSRQSADLDNYQTIISAVQVYYADPAHSMPAADKTFTIKADGTVDTSANGFSTELADAGVDASNITMKSELGKNATITFDVDSATGTYKFTINNSGLAKALGIAETVTPPAGGGGGI